MDPVFGFLSQIFLFPQGIIQSTFINSIASPLRRWKNPHAYEPDRPNKRDKPNKPDRRDMSNVETRPLSYSSLSEMAADVPRIKEVFAQQKFG